MNSRYGVRHRIETDRAVWSVSQVGERAGDALEFGLELGEGVLFGLHHVGGGQGIITRQEREGVDKVLNAAAMTYVAAAISTLLTLVYFLLRAGLLGGSDD